MRFTRAARGTGCYASRSSRAATSGTTGFASVALPELTGRDVALHAGRSQRRCGVPVEVPLVATRRGRLVEPEQVGEEVARVRRGPEPVVAPERVAQQRGERVARVVGERGKGADVGARREAHPVRIRRRERHVGDPVVVLADDARAGLELACDFLADAAAVRTARVGFPRRCRRHERVAVDLAVRMIDRRADLAAAVLEHEHVFDLRPREERVGALRPHVDDLAHLGRGQRRE